MRSVRSFVAIVLSSVLLSVVVGCSASSPTDTASEGTPSKSSKKTPSSSSDDDSDPPPSKDTGDTTKKESSPTEPTTTTKKADGAQCKESADCKSDFCVFKSGGSLGMCTKTCDDNIDCDLGSKCVKLGDAPQKACVPE